MRPVVTELLLTILKLGLNPDTTSLFYSCWCVIYFSSFPYAPHFCYRYSDTWVSPRTPGVAKLR